MRDTSYEILDAVISSKIHFETVKLFICHESRIPHLVSPPQPKILLNNLFTGS